jgi:type IV pilus assembly protein PilC
LSFGGRDLQYLYRVRDRQGKVFKGYLQAENESSVINNLLGQNYYILSLKQVHKSSSEIKVNLSKVSNRDLIIMTRQLSTMVTGGMPILTCFQVIKNQTSNKKLIQAISKICTDLEGGMPLWQAVASHPDIFSPIYISMLKAGEMGGKLNTILDRLIIHLEREDEISSKIKSASLYPVIVSLAAIIMVFGLITFVMPTFINVYQFSGATLPKSTRILLNFSSFLHDWFFYLAVGIVLLVIVLKYWAKTVRGRLSFDYIYLHLPIFGKVLAHIIVARFARIMGILIRSGIPVLAALEVAQGVVGNAVISRAIYMARKSIGEGESISQPLAATGVFEPLAIHMIAVGEESGTLGEMFIRLAEHFEKELVYMLESLLAIVEPVLILLVAVLVGGIVIATISPIFEIVNVLG